MITQHALPDPHIGREHAFDPLRGLPTFPIHVTYTILTIRFYTDGAMQSTSELRVPSPSLEGPKPSEERPHPDFLDLPTELSLMVYKELLLPYVSRAQSEILRTSKQINLEAEDLWYQRTTLHISAEVRLILDTARRFSGIVVQSNMDEYSRSTSPYWRQTIDEFAKMIPMPLCLSKFRRMMLDLTLTACKMTGRLSDRQRLPSNAFQAGNSVLLG